MNCERSIRLDSVDRPGRVGHTRITSDEPSPTQLSPTQLKSLKETARNHFGQTTESPDWNPDADLNDDGRVDIRDKRILRDLFL